MKRGPFQWMSGKRWVAAFAAVLVVAALGWLAIGSGLTPSQPAAVPAPVAQAPQATLPAASAPLADASQPDDVALSQAMSRVTQLLQTGSLRGTQMDGDWGKWVDGRLQPSRSLRRRFDYLLSGMGEVGVADLRLWIGQQVRTTLGEAQAGQVLAVWDRYLTALQSATEIKRDPADAEGWQRATAQLGMLRRNALGPDWAYAFYADEEQADEAFLARHQLALKQQPKGSAEAANTDVAALMAPAGAGLTAAQLAARDAQRVAAFGPEAAERLRTEDAAQAAWAQQLATVRGRLAAIDADPQLSALQRQQAREAEVTRQYSGTALVRARALLGMP